jgi:hypothetical protein
MELVLAMVGFGVLFVLFAIAGAGERTRPCGGRSRDGDLRCRSCPLRDGTAGRRGRCAGREAKDGAGG